MAQIKAWYCKSRCTKHFCFADVRVWVVTIHSMPYVLNNLRCSRPWTSSIAAPAAASCPCCLKWVKNPLTDNHQHNYKLANHTCMLSCYPAMLFCYPAIQSVCWTCICKTCAGLAPAKRVLDLHL